MTAPGGRTDSDVIFHLPSLVHTHRDHVADIVHESSAIAPDKGDGRVQEAMPAVLRVRLFNEVGDADGLFGCLKNNWKSEGKSHCADAWNVEWQQAE